MAFEQRFFGAYRMRAKAFHELGQHWVDTEIVELGGKMTKLPVVHFSTMDPRAERKANAYAAAINEVDKAFHPADRHVKERV